MSREDGDRSAEQARGAYEPPQPLRLDSAREGSGGIPTEECRGPGSGAVANCFTGFGAQSFCVAAGSGAQACSESGSQPTTQPDGEG